MEIIYKVWEIDLITHSGLRWIILLVAAISIVKFALGWLMGSEFKGIDRRLASGFSGLMDLQVVIGIVNLIMMLWSRNEMIKSNNDYCGIVACFLPTYVIMHGVIMLAAAIIAYLPSRWKEMDDKNRFRKSMFVIMASLMLVLIGIFVLRFRPEIF